MPIDASTAETAIASLLIAVGSIISPRICPSASNRMAKPRVFVASIPTTSCVPIARTTRQKTSRSACSGSGTSIANETSTAGGNFVGQTIVNSGRRVRREHQRLVMLLANCCGDDLQVVVAERQQAEVGHARLVRRAGDVDLVVVAGIDRRSRDLDAAGDGSASADCRRTDTGAQPAFVAAVDDVVCIVLSSPSNAWLSSCCCWSSCCWMPESRSDDCQNSTHITTHAAAANVAMKAVYR